jgi:glycosyltransferase XagB
VSISKPDRREFKPLTSIVVPVLNESANVLPLVERVSDAVNGRPTEILFVDDSLNSLTEEAVMVAKKSYSSDTFAVNIFHRIGDMRWGGLSGAITDGMERVLSDQIIVMDGDLQHPPEMIPNMIRTAKHYDMVVASRYLEGGSANGLDGNIRHLVSRGSTMLAKSFFPIRLRQVTDPMTGFFLFDRRKVDSAKLRPKGFKILLEILATNPKMTIAELPLQFAKRVAGESNGTLKQGLEFLSQIVSLRVRQLLSAFTTLPKFIKFGAIGGSVFFVGMVTLYSMVEYLGMSPLAANAIQLAITFWLNYVLNRHVTWRNRSISRLAAYKFLVSRAATTVLSYLLFAWLITLNFSFTIYKQTINFGDYLVANIITLIATMAINYIISDRWVFAQTKPKATNGTKLGPYYTLMAVIVLVIGFTLNPALMLVAVMTSAAFVLLLQSSIEVWRTMYIFRQPDSSDRLRFPVSDTTQEHFAIIVPARHEAAVLADTLHQLAKQTHPNFIIISVICDDDDETLSTAYEVAATDHRVTVMEYPLVAGAKPSKPKQLNYVFNRIKDQGYSVIGVVDAEDTVHPDLIARVDTAFRDQEIGIVQGGVQLMNHDSSWYSLHNVLEYYRWFNSTMVFQADKKFMPLGGNTIFIRNDLLRKADGWPETLTEDCSLGVLLSSRFANHGAKTAVYYEPQLTTREETPDTLKALFKQRVRWNQGFYHEFRKGVWRELPSLRQRLLAGYVLIGPLLMACISVFMVASLITALFLTAPVGLVMLMYLPLVPATLLVVVNAIFLYDFGKAFQRKITLAHYAKVFGMHIPYQIVLNAAAFWSVVRELRGDQSWYKTPHSGKHRAGEAQQSSF